MRSAPESASAFIEEYGSHASAWTLTPSFVLVSLRRAHARDRSSDSRIAVCPGGLTIRRRIFINVSGIVQNAGEDDHIPGIVDDIQRYQAWRSGAPMLITLFWLTSDCDAADGQTAFLDDVPEFVLKLRTIPPNRPPS